MHPSFGSSLAIASVVLFRSALQSEAFSTPTSLATAPDTSHHVRAGPAAGNNLHRHRTPCSALNLVPVSEAWDASISKEQSSFASLLPGLGCPSLNSEGMLVRSADGENKRYRLYLATDVDDLPPIARLTIDVFDASAIALSSTSNWSALERMFVEPAVGAYNSYAQAVGYVEVLSGLRMRMRNRISDGDLLEAGGLGVDYDCLAPLVVPEADDATNEKETTLENIAARSSLILAMARPLDSGEDDMEVVASIELRLQPTDAKIPFSQPWLDKVERRLVRRIPFAKEDSVPVATNKAATFNNGPATVRKGKSKQPPLRPYLCNLCVSPSLRSLGIGRALCRIVELIAQQRWGYDHMYLHVDPTNDAARSLYEKEGYVDVGRRWKVVWAGGAEDISYYVKRLGG